MVKGDKVRLNHELLIWVGFTFSNGIWSYPDGVTVDNGVPFFPGSYSDCLEWLIPTGNITDINLMLDTGGTSQLPSCTVITFSGSYTGYHKDMRVALCLAIKELIRSE